MSVGGSMKKGESKTGYLNVRKRPTWPTGGSKRGCYQRIRKWIGFNKGPMKTKTIKFSST